MRAIDKNQGLQLLRNKLQDTSAEEGAVDLLRALNYMPLTITQAAAYIHQRARITIQGYLAEFRANDKKRENLLHRDAGDLRRDASTSNSVVTTWQISFEHIQHKRPSTTNLLSLMSFFNPQGILESILRDSRRAIAEPGYEDEADDMFNEDFDILRAYSLIAETAEPDTCEMHALVQFCTRVWLSSSGEAERWKGEFVELMAREFPTGDFENWGRCQQLLPHVESLFDAEVVTHELLMALAQILTNVAWYMMMKGSYKTAEELNRRALQGYEKELGERHPDTLTSVNNLALVLGDQGKYGEAEELNRRALEGSEKELGERHPDTLISVYNLAYLLHQQQRDKEARELYQRACSGFDQALGSKHPITTACLNNFLAMQQEVRQARVEQSQDPVYNDTTPFSETFSPKHASRPANSSQGNKKGSIVMRLKEKLRREPL